MKGKFFGKKHERKTARSYETGNRESCLRHMLSCQRPAVWLSMLAVCAFLAAVVCVGAIGQEQQNALPAAGKEEPVLEYADALEQKNQEIEELEKALLEEYDRIAHIWKKGDAIRPGIYIQASGYDYPSDPLIGDDFTPWVEEQVKKEGMGYREIRCAGEEKVEKEDLVEWHILYNLIREDFAMDMCRLTVKGRLTDISFVDKYRLDAFELEISDGIHDMAELKKYYTLESAGISCRAGFWGYPWYYSSWHEGLIVADAIYEDIRLLSSGAYKAPDDPEEAGAWLYGLRDVSSKTVLSNYFGTFIKYCFPDQSAVYIKVTWVDMGEMERRAAGEEGVAEGGSVFYLPESDRSSENTKGGWYTAVIVEEEEMEAYLERTRMIDAFTASKLRNIHAESPTSGVDMQNSDTVYFLTGDQKADMALYGTGDGEVLILRAGNTVKAWNRSWTGMHGGVPRIQCADFDGDGQTEMGMSIHTGTGTGYSVDELLMADKDAHGEFLLYGYNSQAYINELEKRISVECEEENHSLQFFIDGIAQGPPMTESSELLKERPGEEKTRYTGWSVGDITSFDPSTEGTGFRMTTEPGLLWNDNVVPDFVGMRIYADVIYKGNGGFSLSNFSSS